MTARHLLSVLGMGQVDVTPQICHYLSHHKRISIEEGNVEVFVLVAILAVLKSKELLQNFLPGLMQVSSR